MKKIWSFIHQTSRGCPGRGPKDPKDWSTQDFQGTMHVNKLPYNQVNQLACRSPFHFKDILSSPGHIPHLIWSADV